MQLTAAKHHYRRYVIVKPFLQGCLALQLREEADCSVYSFA